MMEWLSVAHLSKISNIPETTARRYLDNFKEFFRYKQIGRGKKYHPDTLEVLQRIAMLYGADYETEEIKTMLSDEFAFLVNDDNDTTTHPPVYDVFRKLDVFQQNQEKFNKELVQQLLEQQRYIQQLIEICNSKTHEKKHPISPEKKRVERFNQIMAEHKVKSKLEKEALSLWRKKPLEEQLVRVGWFRKEEDRDKRDIFIKSYINKHFKSYLKQDFDIDQK